MEGLGQRGAEDAAATVSHPTRRHPGSGLPLPTETTFQRKKSERHAPQSHGLLGSCPTGAWAEVGVGDQTSAFRFVRVEATLLLAAPHVGRPCGSVSTLVRATPLCGLLFVPSTSCPGGPAENQAGSSCSVGDEEDSSYSGFFLRPGSEGRGRGGRAVGGGRDGTLEVQHEGLGQDELWGTALQAEGQ